ncbi:MAG: hypothetical protein JWP57_489 [Spirosoma sp.]|nr:hypothetical protein [Spirosoma sp.]
MRLIRGKYNNLRNIKAADALEIGGIHVTGPQALRRHLAAYDIRLGRSPLTGMTTQAPQ